MSRRPKVAAPIIDGLHLVDLADAIGEELVAGGHYEARRYTGADLAGRDLTGVVVSECEFLDLAANEVQLRGARFAETRLVRVNAPMFQAARSTWRDAWIEGSRFGAVELFDADLQSVRVSDSKLSFVNLRSATLRDVHFAHCVIDELDLAQARAERIAFEGCTVGRIRFDHAQLRHVDLRGLGLGGISGISGIESMDGAVISSRQAAELTGLFAEHLGITVAG
ncbi:pentapeptide repeat-containing protein [Pseudactinotalea sp. HY158]|uniref:pentapeptide repeat-containing protein n=1 Tax=Pseudactinotalea sp. HY158 TaxID=2654547 RepID=UPI001E3A1EEC|nr:pentapeptide repeat-containing protein [Pseudactinotalea sp. HY158]